MINRVRYLPPRVQIAGAIVLIGGLMLLRRRHAAVVYGDEVAGSPRPALRTGISAHKSTASTTDAVPSNFSFPRIPRLKINRGIISRNVYYAMPM